jgi:hypothetical protein
MKTFRLAQARGDHTQFSQILALGLEQNLRLGHIDRVTAPGPGQRPAHAVVLLPVPSSFPLRIVCH